jgi:type IV pilus assembly protein PilC
MFMQKFNYVAVDGANKEVRGTVEAPDKPQAITKIRGLGVYPTAITMVGGTGAPKDARRSAQSVAESGKKKSGLNMEIKLPAFLGGRVKAKDLMVLTRQLATLGEAGLPLLRGLRVLLRQTKSVPLREALVGMSDAVESGSTFSESLANYPRIFNNLYVNMVRAGEAGGVLEVVLTRLAEFMEKAEKIKNKVKGAMIYPAVVLTAAIGIVIFLMHSVIPKFKDIFNDLLEGQQLPAVTRFVIGASDLVKNNVLMVGITIIALIILYNLWSRTTHGRFIIDTVKMRLPVFGTLISRTAIARLTRTLGTLLSSGVPILQALMIVRDTSGNTVIARAVQNIHDSVKEGESMTDPMAAAKVFPPMVVSMVEVGEETGALPDMLIRVANTYDDEIDNAVAGLTSIIEPLLILFLAVIVGTIVIAMFMPLISIIGSLSGQSN